MVEGIPPKIPRREFAEGKIPDELKNETKPVTTKYKANITKNFTKIDLSNKANIGPIKALSADRTIPNILSP